MTCGFATHEVTNQPPPLEGLNLYATDCVLVEAVRREAGGAGEERLACFGAWLGAAETQTLGDQANRWPPGLKSHDRFGRRLDEVEFHPAWHASHPPAGAESASPSSPGSARRSSSSPSISRRRNPSGCGRTSSSSRTTAT
jgi:hypothetical protein